MIAVILLATAQAAGAPAQSAIDAERDFAADAQKLGQWTAFKKWSTDDALMFVPQPTKAHDFLKDKANPPTAVFWWPGASYVSCDGTAAVNTGPWVREWGKSVGYFTTVWKRQAEGGWKWIYDAGDALKSARGEGGDVKPVTASCKNSPVPPPMVQLWSGPGTAGGRSNDGTLEWRWYVSQEGERGFMAQIWTGEGYKTVVEDKVAAQ